MREFKMKVRFGGVFSQEAKILAELAPKASMAAVREAWAHGLSVTVLEGEDIVSIAPDGTKTFVKKLEPLK
jgi:hypothetical protein